MALVSVVTSSMARWLRARVGREGAAVFERVDGTLLDDDDFRASDSLGLDGAPWMIFRDAMPPPSVAAERVSARAA